METGQFCGEILWASSLDKMTGPPIMGSGLRIQEKMWLWKWRGKNDDSPVDGMGVPKFSDKKMIWREMPRCHCTLSCLLHFGLCATNKRKMGEWYGIICVFFWGACFRIFMICLISLSSLLEWLVDGFKYVLFSNFIPRNQMMIQTVQFINIVV